MYDTKFDPHSCTKSPLKGAWECAEGGVGGVGEGWCLGFYCGVNELLTRLWTILEKLLTVDNELLKIVDNPLITLFLEQLLTGCKLNLDWIIKLFFVSLQVINNCW